MNKTKIALAVIGILIVGYIFVAPYITVYQMNKAAKNQNGEALSEHVDFPALRQSLKDQMNVMLGKEMAKVAEDNPFATLGAAFAGMMVEKMVDAYVTPSGITELMKGEKPNSEETSGSSDGQRSSEPFSNTSMSYESFSKFSITIKDDKSTNDVKFVLRRHGIDWKLTEIILPC